MNAPNDSGLMTGNPEVIDVQKRFPHLRLEGLEGADHENDPVGNSSRSVRTRAFLTSQTTATKLIQRREGTKRRWS
jgi:hypothetical protein